MHTRAQGEARPLAAVTKRSLRVALEGRFQTLHLMGHYDEMGSVGSPRSANLRREVVMKCLIDADIHEVVLYGCWAGTLLDVCP